MLKLLFKQLRFMLYILGVLYLMSGCMFDSVNQANNSSSNSNITIATLQSITVQPQNSVVVHTNTQFIAIGTYSDRSTQDITQLVTWNLSNAIVATMSSSQSGMLIPQASGITNISASYNNITSNAVQVTVPLTRYVYFLISDTSVIPFGVIVKRCTIDNTTGALSSCGNPLTSTTLSSGYMGLAINKNFVYMTNQGQGFVGYCAIDPTTGNLSNCQDSGAGNIFNSPTNIAFNNGLAYITNQNTNGNNVTYCQVNPITGAFSNCLDASGKVFNYPSGIVFNNGFMYVTNAAQSPNGDVSICTIGALGNLTNCNNSGVFSYSPSTIVVNNGMVYITTQAAGYNNVLFSCKVNSSTGAFSNCTTTTMSNFSSPTEIQIFNTPTNTFAYVANFTSTNKGGVLYSIDSNGVFTSGTVVATDNYVLSLAIY